MKSSFLKHPKYLILRLSERGLFPISDKNYLKLRYKEVFNRELNLDDPVTFNEKLQWLKLYDRNPSYTDLVDKYEVKKIIEEKIGKEYVIPTLGIYNRFDEIDFDKLPDKFVIKCTHDSGGLIVCRDKNKLDLDQVEKTINKHLRHNFYYNGREWPYKNVRPRIMIEKYMQDKNKKELVDYKFYCFNGEPKFLYVSEGLENHETAKIGFFDMNFKKCSFKRNDYKSFECPPKKPENFSEMVKIAKELSKGLKFVRVDLYSINNNVYFGELTFTPNAGLMIFNPPSWDEKIGKMLSLKD